MIPNLLRTSFVRAGLLTLVLLLSCSREKTDQEKFDDLSSGLSYRTYKTASSLFVPPAVKAYNDQHIDSLPPLHETFARAVVSFLWTLSDKPVFALAEVDLMESNNPDPDTKYLAQSLRTMVMYSQGWDELARKNSPPHTDANSEIRLEITIICLIIASEKCHGGSFEESKPAWLCFSQETGINWPYKLADAMAEFEKNKPQEGFIKLKKLTEDPDLPEAVRTELKSVIEKVEKENGDVNSVFFWPRLVTNVLIDELAEKTDGELGKLMKSAQDWKNKLGK